MYGRRNSLTDIWNYIPLPRAAYRALPDAEREVMRAKAIQDMDAAKERRKAEIIEEKAAKKATERTCQICGRGIFANTGLIAHHGYQRPGDGWQTASCRGARQLPYEADRSVLKVEIDFITEHLADAEDMLLQMREEKVSFGIEWTDMAERRQSSSPFAGFRYLKDITRANWDAVKADPANSEAFRQSSAYTFDQLKDRAVRKQKGKVRELREYLTHQQERYDVWRLLEKWTDGTWVAV